MSTGTRHAGDADDNAGDVALLPGASKYQAYRSNLLFAYYDTIEASCISTTPTASLSVTRATGMPGTPSCSAPTGAVKGFPGRRLRAHEPVQQRHDPRGAR